MTTRVSKEPERPRRFHRKSGWGDRNRQLPGPRWDAHDRGEQTTGETVVSAREEIERVETDGGESERPIVSLKRGNHPRDPVERRGRHVMTPLEGNMAGASKPITVSMKQQRSRRRVRDGALIHSGSPRGAIPWGHPALVPGVGAPTPRLPPGVSARSAPRPPGIGAPAP